MHIPLALKKNVILSGMCKGFSYMGNIYVCYEVAGDIIQIDISVFSFEKCTFQHKLYEKKRAIWRLTLDITSHISVELV